MEQLQPFSGSPRDPVRTTTLLVVSGVQQLSASNEWKTGQRDTHEGERDMMDRHTRGEEREEDREREQVGPAGINSVLLYS